MSYEKQNFTDGQVLTAEQLNKMEQYFQYCPQCYVEYGDEIYYLPETQTQSEEGQAVIADAIDGLQIGSKYTVTFNGTQYECISESFSLEGVPSIALGNTTLLGSVSDSNAPFVLVVIPAEMVSAVGAGAFIMHTDGASTITVSISGREEVVHTLPEKFLPKNKVNFVFNSIDEVDDEIISDMTAQDLYAKLINGDFPEIKLTRGANHLKATQIYYNMEYNHVLIFFHNANYYYDTNAIKTKVMCVKCTPEGFEWVDVASA